MGRKPATHTMSEDGSDRRGQKVPRTFSFLRAGALAFLLRPMLAAVFDRSILRECVALPAEAAPGGACPILLHDPIKDSEDLCAISLKLARLGARGGARLDADDMCKSLSAEDVYQLARRLHMQMPSQWASEARAVEVLYRKALRLLPTHAGALCNYGTLQQHSFHNFSVSRMLFERAEALNASSTVVQHSLAVLAQASGQLKDAETRFKRALVSDPTYVPSLFHYASFLAEHRGDSEQAESLYRRAIDNDPENIDMLCTIALFLCSTGKVGKSRRILQQAQRLAPQSPRVLATAEVLSTADAQGAKSDLAAQPQKSCAPGAHGRRAGGQTVAGAADLLLRERRRSAAAAAEVAAAAAVTSAAANAGRRELLDAGGESSAPKPQQQAASRRGSRELPDAGSASDSVEGPEALPA